MKTVINHGAFDKVLMVLILLSLLQLFTDYNGQTLTRNWLALFFAGESFQILYNKYK